MKVFLLSNNAPPTLDGVGDYSFFLLKSLLKRNIKGGIITRKRTDESDAIGKDDTEIEILRIVNNWNWYSIITVCKTLKRRRVIILGIQYVPYGYSRYGVPFEFLILPIIFKWYKIPYFVTFHEVALRTQGDFKQIIVSILQKGIANYLHFFSKFSITSINLYKSYFSVGKKKLHIIPIGANLEQSLDSYNNKQVKENRSFTLVTFGANPVKAELLIDSLYLLNNLKNEQVEFKMIFIGGFPDEWVEKCKKKSQKYAIQDKITFTGYVSNTDIYKYLSLGDLYIGLYNLQNGQGGVSAKSGSIMSAFSAGLPIIATQGDMTDKNLFKHQENIFLIKDLEIETIAKSVLKVTSDIELYSRLKNGSIQTYRNYVNWGDISKKYYDLLNPQ